MKLTDEEVDLIKRIQVCARWSSIISADGLQGGLFPESTVDPYEPYTDYYTGAKFNMAVIKSLILQQATS